MVRVWLLWEKPFWRDEAWVASMTRLSFGEILASDLPAAVGFVMAAKVSAGLSFLPPEVALRLPSLFAGLGILVLTPLLVHLTGATRRAVLLTAWLTAGCQPLIYYSRELKHYGMDTLLWLLGVCLLLYFMDGSRSGRKKVMLSAAFAATLCLAPWLSLASLFPLAAALLLALAACLRRRWWKRLSSVTLYTSLYAASFTVMLVAALRPKIDNPRLWAYWGQARQRLFSYDSWPHPEQVYRAFHWFFSESYQYVFPFLWPWFLPLVLLGLWRGAGSSRGLQWAFIALTTLLTVGAALGNRYLLVDRCLLFMAPVYLAALAQGGALLWEKGNHLRLTKPLAVLIPAACIGLSLTWGGLSVLARMGRYHNADQPRFYYDATNNVEPALEFAAQAVSPGEPVLFMAYAGTQYFYYGRGRMAHSTRWHHMERENRREQFQGWLKTVHKRGWLVFLDSEEKHWLPDLLKKGGYSWSRVFAEKGAQVWKIERERDPGAREGFPPVRARRGQPGGSFSNRPNTSRSDVGDTGLNKRTGYYSGGGPQDPNVDNKPQGRTLGQAMRRFLYRSCR